MGPDPRSRYTNKATRPRSSKEIPHLALLIIAMWLLSAAAVVRDSDDLEDTLACRARPRRSDSRQGPAIIIDRHKSARSLAMREGALSPASRPRKFYFLVPFTASPVP